MSAQALGPRLLRRITRAASLPPGGVLRGWSHGGYWLGFVTPDHHHGRYLTVTREVRWYSEEEATGGRYGLLCYTSCRDLPPIQYGPPGLDLLRALSEPQEDPTAGDPYAGLCAGCGGPLDQGSHGVGGFGAAGCV